jgi:hypothetical protein
MFRFHIFLVLSSLGVVVGGLAFLYARLGSLVIDGIYLIVGSCAYNIFVSFGIIVKDNHIARYSFKRP